MKVLAVDTATRTCSAAVVENETLCAEITLNSGQTHSRFLMRTVAAVVELAGLTYTDLDGFAATSGPGSFTGLRIGIASIKGLAVAAGKPLAGVSSLEALARQAAPVRTLISPWLDARQGEVYYAFYRNHNGQLNREGPENVASPEAVLTGLQEPCLFLGDGARRYRRIICEHLGPAACFAPAFQDVIRASTVAMVGVEKFRHKEYTDAAQLSLTYVRQTFAQLKLAQQPRKDGGRSCFH
jgi:tRNA threonylcarbamoyladenosine biosynthesis protein TsaB